MAIKTNLKTMAPRREQYKKTVALVSGAYYNRKAFPNGQITVYPWDSHIDAWFQQRMREPNKEFALWEAAEKVADMNGANVDEMTLADAMTVVMVAKSIRSACIIDYVSTCPNCGRNEQNQITIPDELQMNAEKKPDYDGFETFTLPDSQDVVKVRLLTIADEKYILGRSEEDRQRMSDHIAHILLPVKEVGEGGTVDNAEEIITWYNALSPRDAEFLEKEQARRYPQLETNLDHKCDGCGFRYQWSLELTRDFFRAGER